MRPRRPTALLAALPAAAFSFLAASLLTAQPARADLQVELANGDKAFGSLLPSTEVETYLVEVAAGSKLQVTLKGRRSRGAAAATVGLRVLGAGDAELGRIVAAVKGGKVTVTPAESDVLRIVVEGASAGDYQLAVKWTPPRKTVLHGNLSAGPAELVAAFDRGAFATIVVKADAGSPARPRVNRIELEAETIASYTPPANVNATSHKVKSPRLPSVGKYVIAIDDAAAAAPADAPFTATIALRIPPARHRTIDLTSRTLGDGALGSGSAQGTVIGPEGGVAAFGLGLGLDGASITVPPGALPYPVALVVGSASPITTPGSSLGPVGPTVSFSPEGLTFDEPVLVTIPLDPALVGADPSVVQVFVRNAQGQVSLVPPPYTINASAGTMSFPVSHFSAYGAFVQPSPGKDLTGDGIDDLVLSAPGKDFRTGAVFVFRGGAARRDADLGAEEGGAAAFGVEGGSQLGRRYAVGDLDADGTADLAVTSNTTDFTTSEVRVYLGGKRFLRNFAQGRFLRFTPHPQDTNLSSDLAIGDVTGDGVADLCVSDTSGGPSGEGSVTIFPGGRELADTAGDAAGVLRLVGAQPGDEFGASVVVGEVTGDLQGDLLVGSTQTLNQGSGMVSVYEGGGAFAKSPGSKRPAVISGGFQSEVLGHAIAVGDLDGDGVGDVIAGSPGLSFSGTLGAISEHLGPVLEDRISSQANGITFAQDDTERLGETLVVARFTTTSGRVGAPAIFAGAPKADRANLTGNGAVYQYEHATFQNGLPPRIEKAGGESGGGFGVALGVLDWDGDGNDDLVVGAPFEDPQVTDAGRVYVYFGPDFATAPRVVIASSSDGGNLGLR